MVVTYIHLLNQWSPYFSCEGHIAFLFLMGKGGRSVCNRKNVTIAGVPKRKNLLFFKKHRKKRVRIGWVKFREWGELLLGNRFPLKMKSKVYRCCVRSAILYGSETWCLKENEKAILRRTERAMVRAMCSQKVVDRKTTEEQMDMLGLKETIDQLATVDGVQWYGHVLRRDDDSVLRVALNLEVSG